MNRGNTIFIALLFGCKSVVAVADNAALNNTHMRCAAVNYLLNAATENSGKDKYYDYKLSMEMHAKWAWVPYGENYPQYKADFDSTLKALQDESTSGKITGEAFAQEALNCITLQRRTMDAYVGCVGRTKPDEGKKMECAKKATGL